MQTARARGGFAQNWGGFAHNLFSSSSLTHPRWVLSFLFLFIYLFFAFDCSLEIFERRDCLYLEGKWVRDGPKIIFGGKFFYFIFAFDCSLEMFERKDCLNLEGKWVRENGNEENT